MQHECIPQAILGMDILCQAKSGMGKTAVFVLATLQQIEPVDGQVRYLLIKKKEAYFPITCVCLPKTKLSNIKSWMSLFCSRSLSL